MPLYWTWKAGTFVQKDPFQRQWAALFAQQFSTANFKDDYFNKPNKNVRYTISKLSKFMLYYDIKSYPHK